VRLSVFLLLFLLFVSMMALVVAAPIIGLGAQEDFILWKLFGLRRGLASSYPAALVVLLCVYQALTIGLHSRHGARRHFVLVTQAWAEGVEIYGDLVRPIGARVGGRAWLQIVAIAMGCVCIFAVFIYKDIMIFKFNIDQHWYQAMVDYDVDWRSPRFTFAGNLLYQFGIQLPLKTQLLPLLGLSQFAPKAYHITVAVVLMFFATGGLFCAIGHAIGLRPLPRVFFAGAVALITTVPKGIDSFLWIFPPDFFTSQSTLALWWLETPISRFRDGSCVLLAGAVPHADC